MIKSIWTAVEFQTDGTQRTTVLYEEGDTKTTTVIAERGDEKVVSAKNTKSGKEATSIITFKANKQTRVLSRHRKYLAGGALTEGLFLRENNTYSSKTRNLDAKGNVTSEQIQAYRVPI